MYTLNKKQYLNGYQLDKKQQKIVLSNADSILVIAGAGSGKSLTILAKILYLIKNGINPSDILCISFTNAASNNLKTKLKQNGIDMKIYTFHKLGMEILKKDNANINITGDNTLMTIIYNVLKKTNFLEVLPDYDFKDFGTGDFSKMHHLLALETKEFKQLQKLFFTFINLFKGNNYNILKFDDFFKINKRETNKFKRNKNEKLLKIAKQIYEEYSYYLEKNKSIDFHDMINKAIDIVKNKGIYNYKYIIIDEYQDASIVKCELLKSIKEKTKAKIMAVGDDFQSIYRFTGSNLKVFLDFKFYFAKTKIFKLEKTYRNSKELLDIMSKFILKNKKQIKKKLKSDKLNNTPIYIYYYNKSIKEVWNEVIKEAGDDALILGRNNKDIEKINTKNKMTVHKSKGLEAENVIIVHLEDGVDGFPNKITTDDFLKFVTNDIDEYPFEEERRLFYVAMTRTKNNNYLLVNKNKPSIFVQELIKDNKNIKIMNDNFCPICGLPLVKRSGKCGLFYGCLGYPKCTYTKDYY